MKKNTILIIFAFALLFLAVSCGNALNDDSKENDPGKTDNEDPGNKQTPPVLNEGDLSIHFLELGNKYVGDCVYINYGTMDVIIDAGSKHDSASTIIAYINNYIQDDKVEYVIATHAHEDHIAGFYSNYYVKGILDAYEIGTIIDYPLTNNNTKTRENYENARDNLVATKGTVHYNALQCYNEENGAKRIYDLGGNVKLEILYSQFYETYSAKENNYSVAVKISQEIDGFINQYIFTGDMEIEAEDGLVDFYETSGGLGHCVLYKGGHHGSNTSSNVKLMAAVSPEYVCVCSCAGTYEYAFNVERNRFPSQGFIDRVAPYTDAIYVTSFIENKAAYDAGDVKPFNGTIVFLVSNGEFSINCSNNNLKLKDTEWFKNNRDLPSTWQYSEPVLPESVLLPAAVSMYPRP